MYRGFGCVTTFDSEALGPLEKYDWLWLGIEACAIRKLTKASRNEQVKFDESV